MLADRHSIVIGVICDEPDGVWGLATGREDLGDDATAAGFKIDYPNDLVDMAITYSGCQESMCDRVGEGGQSKERRFPLLLR